MADLGEENKVTGVFGGVEFNNNGENNNNNVNANFNIDNVEGENNQVQENAGTIRNTNLPIKSGFWSKFKAFWLQEVDWKKEIKVELTPYQQKVEDEINEFLHQEITWEKVHDFLFQEISFGKKKTEV